MEDLETYAQIRKETADDLEARIREIFLSKYKVGLAHVSGQADIMLRDIILGNDSREKIEWKDSIGRIDKSYKVDDPYTFIHDECKKLESVKYLVSYYDTFVVGHTDWLIEELARVIRYINLRYEIQNELF